MCYSAQIWADYRRYIRSFQVQIDIKQFIELFWRRKADSKIKIPRALEIALSAGGDELATQLRPLVQEYTAEQVMKTEQDLFKQRKRLADAERALTVKVTKAATESKRIATDKVEAGLAKLADLQRKEPKDRDNRIFPGWYAPVMFVENGQRVLRMMRYQCRPEGKPAFYDTKYPGTYNARRDNLNGFWKELWGFSHGLMVTNAFFENVNRHRREGRELAEGEKVENEVLQFRPRPEHDMLVACLWSKWSAPGEPDLYSFAAITDEPPEEVAAAGHDRCIVPIKPENIDAWLNPDARNLDAQEAILEDRDRPYYEYRLAA